MTFRENDVAPTSVSFPDPLISKIGISASYTFGVDTSSCPPRGVSAPGGYELGRSRGYALAHRRL